MKAPIYVSCSERRPLWERFLDVWGRGWVMRSYFRSMVPPMTARLPRLGMGVLVDRYAPIHLFIMVHDGVPL